MSHRDAPTMLRGVLLRRARSVDRLLLKAQNELCAILIDVHPSIADPALEDHLVDVPLQWKYVQYKGVAGKKGYCGTIMKLRQPETDPSKGIADAALVFWWRALEATGKGPSMMPSGISVDLTSGTDEEPSTTRLDRSANRCPQSRSKEQAVPKDEQTVLKNALGNKVVRQ
ncbi:hypothetical protein LTR74_008509 [Friedmanniomyces endolithicus]|nr:hypothetical protein LTR74_008509 [Friedmanniomyces endolithicus]